MMKLGKRKQLLLDSKKWREKQIELCTSRLHKSIFIDLDTNFAFLGAYPVYQA
jgi:hypothetical protein